MHLIVGEIRGPETYYDMQTGTPRVGNWFWAEVREGAKARLNFCVGVLAYEYMKAHFSDVDEVIRDRVSTFVENRLKAGWNPAGNVEIVLTEQDLDAA